MADQLQVKPLEDLCLEGLLGRVKQVFNCPYVMYTTAADKVQSLNKLFNGNTLTYPYAFLTVNSVGRNPDSYNPNSLARRGLIVSINGDTAATVRLVPCNFEIELEYHTDRYQQFTGYSVLAYLRRWVLAQQMGYLKFNINYGRLAVAVSATLADATGIPLRDSVTDTEAVYKVTTNLTLHGYVSEPTLGSQGVINAIELDQLIQGTTPGQFFSFE